MNGRQKGSEQILEGFFDYLGVVRRSCLCWAMSMVSDVVLEDRAKRIRVDFAENFVFGAVVFPARVPGI